MLQDTTDRNTSVPMSAPDRSRPLQSAPRVCFGVDTVFFLEDISHDLIAFQT